MYGHELLTILLGSFRIPKSLLGTTVTSAVQNVITYEWRYGFSTISYLCNIENDTTLKIFFSLLSFLSMLLQ